MSRVAWPAMSAPVVRLAPTVAFCVPNGLRVRGGGAPGQQQERGLIAIEAVVAGEIDLRLAQRAADAHVDVVVGAVGVGDQVGRLDLDVGRVAVGDRLGGDEGDVVDVGDQVEVAAHEGDVEAPVGGADVAGQLRDRQRPADVQDDVGVDLGREVVLHDEPVADGAHRQVEAQMLEQRLAVVERPHRSTRRPAAGAPGSAPGRPAGSAPRPAAPRRPGRSPGRGSPADRGRRRGRRPRTRRGCGR